MLVLGAVNWSIVAKERIKTQGERIYLALAPVDPRSLMQGDYMALRFELASNISAEAEGSAPLFVDARGIATLNPSPATARSAHSLSRAQSARSGSAPTRTSSKRATAGRYEGARYGEFRIDRDSGEAVLVGLADENLKSPTVDSRSRADGAAPARARCLAAPRIDRARCNPCRRKK